MSEYAGGSLPVSTRISRRREAVVEKEWWRSALRELEGRDGGSVGILPPLAEVFLVRSGAADSLALIVRRRRMQYHIAAAATRVPSRIPNKMARIKTVLFGPPVEDGAIGVPEGWERGAGDDCDAGGTVMLDDASSWLWNSTKCLHDAIRLTKLYTRYNRGEAGRVCPRHSRFGFARRGARMEASRCRTAIDYN